MLTSEFSDEMAALIRGLQRRVEREPDVRFSDPKDHIDRAIIALVELRLSLDDSPQMPVQRP